MSTHSHFNKTSIEYRVIEDLLESFNSKNISVEYVFEKTKIRSEALERAIPLFHEEIDISLKDIELSIIMNSIILILHRSLFRNLYTFAGNFRKKDDAWKGIVTFARGTKEFIGCDADRIETELERICSKLSRDDPTPIETGLQFFREFLYLHPFYDGNGRISRAITSIYLRYHSLYIIWKSINKSKYLEYLTKCHVHHGLPSYTNYFGFLCDHFKKNIESINSKEY